jgi:phage gpG-like protein
MRLFGDFGKFDRLISRAGAIASPTFRRDLLAAMATEVNRQITLGFQRSRDPYGHAWKPLSSGAGRPLMNTGELARAAASATSNDSTVFVHVDLVKGHTHQNGAVIRARYAKALRFRVGGRVIFRKSVTIPARPFLPDGDLPPAWREALSRVVAAKLALIGG